MNGLRFIVAWLVCCVAFVGLAQAADKPQPETTWECRWAASPITIDGRADEPAWAKAQLIDRFTIPWLPDNPKAQTATRAKLLWDVDALYFFADMDDGDLFADIVEKDGDTWNNDVFELFFKPAVEKKGYFEFQVNAIGTTFDLFVPVKPDRETYLASKKDNFTWQSKVTRRGTLNDRDDRDQGWTVEGRIPWLDFLQAGARPKPNETWRFALCRYDYDKQWKQPSLSTCAPLTDINFHQVDKYAPLKFIGPQEGEAKPFGLSARVPLTTSKVVGSPDPPPLFFTVPAYPQFKLSRPIMVRHVPGTDQMLALIHERPEGGGTSLIHFKDDPEVTEFETLHKFSGTAYDICFHPRFAENGYVYFGWNGLLNDPPLKKQVRISRFTLNRPSPGPLDPQTEQIVISWPSRGHDGAAMAFGNDGMFYVTSGDGTTDSDEDIIGQDMTKLLAKVLRIDVDHVTDADRADDRNYSIPRDNPFVSLAGARPETWAYGLRNPWRMAADPKTGHIWLAQNGQDVYEQVYLVRRGENYGWSVTEGGHPFYMERKQGPTPIVKPTVEHGHSEARSLTGGVVYHGEKYPEIRGAYIYGDYSTGKIWAVRHDGQRVTMHREIADTSLFITAISHDSHGELLVADYRNGGEKQIAFSRFELTPPQTEPSTFPRKLSESGLFEPGRGHKVVPGVIPYTVNAPLWSDGTYKERFIALPGEETITYVSRRVWNFPEQTVLIKSFALETEPGRPESRRWIETRFLTKQANEWVGYSYAWNDEQTDATLVESAGRDRNYEVADSKAPGGKRQQTWHYPSRAECMICHSQAGKYVLGLSTAQLNCDHDYDGVRDNQLRALAHAGIVKGIEGNEWKEGYTKAGLTAGRTIQQIDYNWPGVTRANAVQRRIAFSPELGISPENYERFADPYDRSAPLEKRAKAYLHANCAHCHTHSGGGNARIQLTYWTSENDAFVIDAFPLHARFDMKKPRIVSSGNPEESLLLHRMAIRGRGQMPPLSSSLVDHEAVEMIREWIASIPPVPVAPRD